MKLKAEWAPYTLDFLFEARTSRESMRQKSTWLVRLTDTDTSHVGVGECALFRGLSADDTPDYEQRLAEACRAVETAADAEAAIHSFAESSIIFGFETALGNLNELEDNSFTRGEAGIPINGLIWMGDKATMRNRIDEKLAKGFNVLKLKIGGIDFESEVDLLHYVRSVYSPDSLEIRLDANGSFSPGNAMKRLDELSRFSIHSIEQPIKQNQWAAMAGICAKSPIPVALDEDLIGKRTDAEKAALLETVNPQYIILKPALCGGLTESAAWIEAAVSRKIGWWATSALESNIGLDAIARWCFRQGAMIPQGLGTGQLYSNNFPSPLELRGDRMFYHPAESWDIPQLPWRQ